MKTIRALGVTLMAVSMTFASTVLAGPGGQIGVGNRVAAMWSNGGYFLGTVTEIEGDRYNILFEDGDRLAVNSANVVALREDMPFSVGDRVVAAWKGISMYPGVVTKVHAKSCMVGWDDGDEPLLVAKDKIFHADKAVAATTAATAFNVGDHVTAMWRDSRYYPGIVTEVRGSQCLIKWDDGDEPLFVLQEHIRSLSNAPSASLNVGDHVLATWKDGHKYPGVIAEARGDLFLIRWDDGDEPMLVAKDKILPFPQQQVQLLPGATPTRQESNREH
ncbi:DUF4537 domain-containing protein [Roseimicrobium sp. ORNL1]|uniref:DUF4537 domain-containing protein n=1 Tax=Roseimicrobium sp. ORNL1 TaxID=2711231 RepID=UPI0013E1FC8F|nr:DUF4537 domain-containing protein [Roseimicrobium sp. ORNL1]QIF01372.1 DUF4537 domain-containing protein [Roseimicrobium sp. ORNL1]